MSRERIIVIAIGAWAAAGCAMVLGLPDPSLDEEIPVGGGSSSGGSSGIATDAQAFDGEPDDAGSNVDADPANRCRADLPWVDVQPLTELNSDSYETGATLSADELEILFTRAPDFAFVGTNALYRATRANAGVPFDPPILVTSTARSSPCLSPLGNSLYYTNYDPTDASPLGQEFRRGNRVDGGFNANPGAVQTGLASPGRVACRTFLSDAAGDIMYFHSEDGIVTSPQTSVRRATKSGTNSWTPSVEIDGLKDPGHIGSPASPVVRDDELEIFYALQFGEFSEVFASRRQDSTNGWGSRRLVTELGVGGFVRPLWLSTDSCRLYFARVNANTKLDLYVAHR